MTSIAELLEATRDVEITVLQITTEVPEAGTVQYWFAVSSAGKARYDDDDEQQDGARGVHGRAEPSGRAHEGRVKVSGNIPKLMASQKALNGLMAVIGRVTTLA